LIANAPRIVLDTNVLVSTVCWLKTSPAQAYFHAIRTADLICSDAVRDEYRDVFSRPKFEPYAQLDLRIAFLEAFLDRCTPVVIIEEVAECRDIKDNKILALALNGSADLILTGDADLVALHPWRGIDILTPIQYLAHQAENDLP
jgi:putative PIN family toxin of toxin-antitoxin system